MSLSRSTIFAIGCGLATLILVFFLASPTSTFLGSSDGDDEGQDDAESAEADVDTPQTLPDGSALDPEPDGDAPEGAAEEEAVEEVYVPPPPPENYVPGTGYEGGNGTFYTTYAAPLHMLEWMQSPRLIFNQPLPPDTPTVANNEQFAAQIDEIIRGNRLYNYGSGIEDEANAPYMLFVDSDVEEFTEVVFAPQVCGSDTWWSWTAAEFEPYINGAFPESGKWGIPLPAGFTMNANDGDFHLMVYDWRTDVMIELWKAQTTNITGRPGIEACWGGITKDFTRSSEGIYPFPVGVDAAGLSAAGLTLTLEDVRRGEILHAIGVSTEIVLNNGDTESFSYPANRNDGFCAENPTSDRSREVTDSVGGSDFCLLEGQYLRFPADFDVDGIEHPLARMIAKAGRDYGFIVHDVAGCFCIQAESARAVTENGLSDVNPWLDVYGDTPEWEILWQIDWTQLEILPADWNRPDGYQIACATPPGVDPTQPFPMSNDSRCQLPGDPYLPG